MESSRFVFLDRDGTLVFDIGHGHRVEDYQLLPGVLEALALLQQAGFRFAIVTNQSGIGRGFFTQSDFERFQGRLFEDLSAAGIEVAATFVCPHLPDAGCPCRKPSPATLFEARERFGIDLAASWMIGDHANDVRLAANAGCHAILLLTGHGVDEQHELGDTPVDAVLPDLLAAARYIVAREARYPSSSGGGAA